MSSHEIAARLRSARRQRGWSRETLAHHSGISWAAIAQIESGRRPDPRVSSLSRLATALDITIDELVHGKATERKRFEHSALFYGSADDYTTAAAAFLHQGVVRDERPLAVTSSTQIRRLRQALGADADTVTFAESVDWYRTPNAALNGYRDYLNDQVAAGARRVRILGEPVWRGRAAAETKAWIRYESLINIVFADSTAVLMCPYDVRSSKKAIIDAAHRTHPRITRGVREETSDAFREAEIVLLEP